MTSSPSPFAAWFGVDEHADVLLRVCTDRRSPAAKEPNPANGEGSSEAGSAQAPSTGSAARSLHCHAVILSANSEYFKAQLSSSWQQPTCTGSNDSTTGAGSKKVVTIHVEEGELEAVHEMLRMMYSQTLPAAAAPTTPLFLRCLDLADRFQAISCVELLIAALAATPTQQFDCTLLTAVFQASPGVCISRSFPSLQESSRTALLRLFGDVPSVIKDEELSQHFCSLPHAAVLAWAQSDELKVHSENCVVFLLSAWVKANQSSTAAQHEELAQQIRVFRLGLAYLHHILPCLPWFKVCSCAVHVPAVQTCIRAGITVKDMSEKRKWASRGMACPPQWMAKPRRCSYSSRTGSWITSSSQLTQLKGRRSQRMTPPLYVNGFLMEMKVQQYDTAPSAPTPGKTLGVYRGVDTAAMSQRGVPCPEHTMLPLGVAHDKVGSAGSETSKQSNLDARSLLVLPRYHGTPDFLGVAAPTLSGLVAPYLEGRQLHIEATFTTVDIIT